MHGKLNFIFALLLDLSSVALLLLFRVVTGFSLSKAYFDYPLVEIIIRTFDALALLYVIAFAYCAWKRKLNKGFYVVSLRVYFLLFLLIFLSSILCMWQVIRIPAE